jgi:hypothetical protein
MHTPPLNPSSPSPPRRWYLAPTHLLVAVFWGGFFCWLNRLPLQSNEFWGQVSYGKWILANRALPAEDPFSPLAAGMRLFDTAWLSQVIYAAVNSWGGVEALSALFAATVVVAHLVLARAFYLQTRQLLVAHLGVLLVAAVSLSRLPEANADMFGMLCFAVLLWLLVRDRVVEADTAAGDLRPTRIRWALWLGIPLLLALWANLHGSFTCGLLVLVCWFVGAAIEAAWHERTLRGVVGDPAVRRWLWLCELGLAAACLNPYGVQLVLYNTWFADLRQLRELPAWEPLVLLQPGGRELVASLLVAMLVFRFSRKRLPVADLLLLAAFSFVFGGGVRMAWWYAAVFGLAVTPHVAEIGTRWLNGVLHARRTHEGVPNGPWFLVDGRRAMSYTVMAAGLFWICFALSPAWDSLVRGRPRPPERLYGGGTPWKLSQYLRENPPQGQVFHPHWWGDWLIWDGPTGLRPFLMTNLNLVPPKVWTDYRIIRETRSGWEDVLLRYGARTVILDKHRQTTLHRFLRGSDQWELQYEDELSLVFAQAEGKPSVRRLGEAAEQGVSFDE